MKITMDMSSYEIERDEIKFAGIWRGACEHRSQSCRRTGLRSSGD